MKIVFYGVRGSYPTPEREFLKYGGNTSSLMVEHKDFIVLFDAGTGIINAGKDINNKKEKPIYIFLSHTHLDHIEGLPFFQPFFNNKYNIELYGPKIEGKSFVKSIEKILNSDILPFSLNNLNLKIYTLSDEEKRINIKTNNKNPIYIETKKFKDHPLNGVHLFSLIEGNKKIVYATDIEANKNHNKDIVNFIKKADVLIFDSHFTETELSVGNNNYKGYGHSTFEIAIKLKKLADVKKLYFFHYNPFYNDEFLDRIKDKYQTPEIQFSMEKKEVIV